MAREMKDSGIEWIGMIPFNWEIAKLSYFFDIQLGKMLQPESRGIDDTLEYYLCAANLGKNSLNLDTLKQMWFSPNEKDKFGVRKGDLLVVEGGDVASCDIVNDDVHDIYIQNALHRVRSKAGYDLRLLRYYLIFAKACGYIDLICNKATIAHFTKDKFSSMPYPVLSFEEQNEIADYLDRECSRIDSVIEQTRASIEEYKKLKQAIITQAVTKGIIPNREMKDSGIEWIGEMPDNWETKKLKYLSDFMQTKYCSDEGDLNYIGLENITGWNGCYIETESVYDRDQALICDAGDILFGKLRPYLAKVYISPEKQCCSGEFAVIRIHEGLCRKFFWYQLISHGFIFMVDRSTYGTKMPRANVDYIKNISMAVPPIKEQIEIVECLNQKCTDMESLIQSKQQFILELESYKKSLIFEYVTGKREVPA